MPFQSRQAQSEFIDRLLKSIHSDPTGAEAACYDSLVEHIGVNSNLLVIAVHDYYYDFRVEGDRDRRRFVRKKARRVALQLTALAELIENSRVLVEDIEFLNSELLNLSVTDPTRPVIHLIDAEHIAATLRTLAFAREMEGAPVHLSAYAKLLEIVPAAYRAPASRHNYDSSDVQLAFLDQYIRILKDRAGHRQSAAYQEIAHMLDAAARVLRPNDELEAVDPHQLSEKAKYFERHHPTEFSICRRTAELAANLWPRLRKS